MESKSPLTGTTVKSVPDEIVNFPQLQLTKKFKAVPVESDPSKVFSETTVRPDVQPYPPTSTVVSAYSQNSADISDDNLAKQLPPFMVLQNYH